MFVKPEKLVEATGLSVSTFKRYRLTGIWIEGIHWYRINSRLVLYNLPLISDWVANRMSPRAHERAVENYLRSLPSNQPKKRGRGRQVNETKNEGLQPTRQIDGSREL
jgi:hypothetical protein